MLMNGAADVNEEQNERRIEIGEPGEIGASSESSLCSRIIPGHMDFVGRGERI